MTRMRPALGDLDQLVEPLSEAESQVARSLSRLGDGWTVYVKPRIGLDRPDFLAIHDHYGICAIEVRAWLPHAVRQSESDGFEFSTETGGWTPSHDQPRFEASRYRLTIYDQFFALPEDGGTTPAEIRAMVVMPYFTTEQAMHLFNRPGITDEEQLVGVWGSDVLDRLAEPVQGLGSQPPNPSSIRRLREHVVISERVTVDPSAVVPMSTGVTEIATNPRGLNARRFRGAAGSGKTFGITARAARLAAEGKSVLLLSFNVTLANRLRLLATDRCQEVGANPTLITCANFHTFCTRVVQDAEVAGLHLQAPAGAAWTVAIVAKVEQAFAQGLSRTYDAILIDEGQDFTADWWQLLRSRVLTPAGEMLIVADPTQDVYGRYEWAVDDSIGGTGLSGPWGELHGSYRLPDDLLGFANEFSSADLEGDVISMVKADDHASVVGELTANGSVRRWTNVDRVNDLGRAVGLEVVRMLNDNPSLTPGDVTFLCDYHHDGVAAVRVIESAGIPVHHIFSRDPDAPRRRRKHRFWPGVDAVTGCTMHSYKGWETPALAVGIGADARARRVGYVSMTRLAALPDGRPSVISVLNADKRLAALSETFEAGSKAPAPRAQRPAPTPLAVAPPATPVPFAAPAIHVPPPPAAASFPAEQPAATSSPAPVSNPLAAPVSPLSAPMPHTPTPAVPPVSAAVNSVPPPPATPAPDVVNQLAPSPVVPQPPAAMTSAAHFVEPLPMTSNVPPPADVVVPMPLTTDAMSTPPPMPTDMIPTFDQPMTSMPTPTPIPAEPLAAVAAPLLDWSTPDEPEPAPPHSVVADPPPLLDAWSDAPAASTWESAPLVSNDGGWNPAPLNHPTPEFIQPDLAPLQPVPAAFETVRAPEAAFTAPMTTPMPPPPPFTADSMPTPVQVLDQQAPPSPPLDNWSAPVG